MPSSFQPQQQAKVSLSQRMIAFPLRHLQQAIGSLGDLWRTPFTTLMTLLVLGISLTLPATLHLFVKKRQYCGRSVGFGIRNYTVFKT